MKVSSLDSLHVSFITCEHCCERLHQTTNINQQGGEKSKKKKKKKNRSFSPVIRLPTFCLLGDCCRPCCCSAVERIDDNLPNFITDFYFFPLTPPSLIVTIIGAAPWILILAS
ncbi:unnamed protein product [Coffea canephora]|uniref:Uncharacterized protein n=1 Tax=Coffea canephora TaxID=49390 RepID=A0A068UPY9_COFCA|nr:unnamed protein product [Coffea canephora]